MKKLTTEQREKYIAKERKILDEETKEFSVSEFNLVEAAFYRAKSKWEADGFIDEPTSFTSISQKEKSFVNRILP